jgi:hypothetical protein
VPKRSSVDGINVESIVIATLGAIAILLVVHFGTGLRGRRQRPKVIFHVR